MSKKNKKGNNRIVFSTNPDFEPEDNRYSESETPRANQKLYVSIDRKKRRGKEVTLIEGYEGTEDGLKDLAKLLKQKCGVGGSAKDGEIVVQGNKRDKVIEILLAEGFGKVIRKGG